MNGNIEPSADRPNAITSAFYRVRRRHGKDFVSHKTETAPAYRPARVAVMLALAHKIQQAIDSGALIDRATVARELGLTRARLTQLLDLTLIAPDVQEQILELESIDGLEPISERQLRPICRYCSWNQQRELWDALRAL